MGESAIDPVFHDHTTNQWFFWDESWSRTEGPYVSEYEARAAFKEYCLTILANAIV